jgi:hypothetical protein
VNNTTPGSSPHETSCAIESFQKDNWRQNLLLTAMIGALPTVLAGFYFLKFLSHEALTSPDVFQVIEKSKLAPDRYSIGMKTATNANGGSLTVVKNYPLSFFDQVQLGDTIHSGFCHYRVIRNDSLYAIYIPWEQLFPIGYLPLAWCLSAVIWLYGVSWFRSLPVIILVLVSELSFLTALSWGIILRLVL